MTGGQNTEDIAGLEGTAFEVIEILEPSYVAADLQDAVRVGGEIPVPATRRTTRKEPR